MQPFEYSLVLTSILVSLALANIVMCFHRLLRNARRVTWDGRVLIAAALVIVEIVRLWFATWTVRDVTQVETFSVYLGIFVQILLLVLLGASALPEEVGETCDLGAFYDGNRRYFWGVFALYQLSYFLMGFFVFGVQQGVSGGTVDAFDLFRMLAPLAIYVVLTFARVKPLDYLLPLAVIVFYLVRYWNQALVA
ncbi:MAG TPA: hypothetical protein VGG69_08495 [Rhizomicrobium sp.]